MKRRLIAIAVLACACSGAPPSGAPTRARSPAAVYTIDGRVLGTDSGSPTSPDTNVRVTIQPDGQPAVVVELAPGWYLDRRGVHFSEQERLQVEAYRDGHERDAPFVARRVWSGQTIVDLRDESGKPSWSSPVTVGR